MYKINVRCQVEEMERVLRTPDDVARCQAAITILRRWQFDEMLDDSSREKAKMLVLEIEWSLPAATNVNAVAPPWSAAASAAILPDKMR